MSNSFLEPAFAHHVWASLRLIDACLDLSAEELETSIPGTRGPMLETFRHVVESGAFDLYILTGDRTYDVDARRMSLSEVRALPRRAERVPGRSSTTTVKVRGALTLRA